MDRTPFGVHVFGALRPDRGRGGRHVRAASVRRIVPPIERPDGRLAVRVHVSVPATLKRPVEYRMTAYVACSLVQRELGGYRVEYPPVVIGAA